MSIYTLGIDIGSTASKCVMLADGKEIVAKSLISVGAGTSGPQRAIDEVLESAGKKREEMAFVLATGYGRNSLMNYADKQMSELSCHAKGAHFLFPEVHTVIDIGGQDVKVLQIEDGIMTKGVIVRHMMLPGLLFDSKKIIDYLYNTFGDSIYISIMNQYTPTHRAKQYKEISKPLNQRHYDALIDYALDLGITNAFIQEEGTASESFIPAFDFRGV